VSKRALRAYLAAMRRSADEWARVRREAQAALGRSEADQRASTLAAVADDLRLIAVGDRSGRLAKRVRPPAGLEATHRRLVGSSAVRKRFIIRVAGALDAAAAGRLGPLLTLDDFDDGTIRRPRRAWVRAVAAEARAHGIRLPAWARRIGAG
jgi:hypothetical protein